MTTAFYTVGTSMMEKKTSMILNQGIANKKSHVDKDIISTTKKISVLTNLVAIYWKISAMYSKWNNNEWWDLSKLSSLRVTQWETNSSVKMGGKVQVNLCLYEKVKT